MFSHAVYMKILPMVTKRLGNEERGAVAPGSVYIWEERGVDGTSGGRFVTLSDALFYR